MNRRSFASTVIPVLVGFLGFGRAGFGRAQSAVMKGEKAISCDGVTTVCPNGHKTCRNIDMPMAIGNENRSYPETHVLFDYKVMFCTSCSVLFVEKQ